MPDDPVTEREFERYIKAQNGSLDRIEKSIGEVKRMLGESQRQTLELLGDEVDAREKCASCRENIRAVNAGKFDALEKAVGSHETKLTVTTWVWRGLAGLLGITLTVVSIIVMIRVL